MSRSPDDETIPTGETFGEAYDNWMEHLEEQSTEGLMKCHCGNGFVTAGHLVAQGDGRIHSLTRCRTYLREINTVDASTLDLLHYARENDMLRNIIIAARQRILAHRFTSTDQACARSLLEILAGEEQ